MWYVYKLLYANSHVVVQIHNSKIQIANKTVLQTSTNILDLFIMKT